MNCIKSMHWPNPTGRSFSRCRREVTRCKPKDYAMFKAIVAALALSLFACAAEPGSAEDVGQSGADIVTPAPASDVITVIAVAKVRPETRSDFVAAAKDLVRGT